MCVSLHCIHRSAYNGIVVDIYVWDQHDHNWALIGPYPPTVGHQEVAMITIKIKLLIITTAIFRYLVICTCVGFCDLI